MGVETFASVLGNELPLAQLSRAVKKNAPAHAYLLVGERGSGKRHLAKAFAAALLCESGTGDACKECISCKKADAGNHPDILTVVHEKPDTLSVGEVREQLVNSVSIRPNESKWKVYIVPDAEKMNVQAQNAMLKTIEEPPAYAVILLLTTNAEAMLPTIRSRCMELHLSPLPEETVQTHLIRRYGLSKEAASAAAALAQGNLGRAKEIAGEGQVLQQVEEMVNLLKRAPEMEAGERLETIESLKGDKEALRELLQLLTLWFRDVLLFKATQDADNTTFPSRAAFLREEAQHASYEGLERILSAIQTAEMRLAANVGEEITLELLLLTLRDELA